MNSEILFSQALGLQSPWKVEDIRFSNGNISAESELHIYIGFESGEQFVDELGALCSVHDSVDRKWQHLEVPWARPGSGFTLLFEAMALALIEREMPVNRGAAEAFPSAEITFDRFHVVKLLNEAMNQVRINERKEHEALKGHKYTFLRNRENLSVKQEKALSGMIELYPTLGQAYRLKELFNDLWSMPDKVSAEAFLNQWCTEVERARGYRNIDNFINMIYFICGKLKFDYPLYFT